MQKESTVKERLTEYLRKKRITQMEFTRSIDVSPTYIGAMRKGISAAKLRTIMERYPDLNRDWLLYGEGEMLKDETKEGRKAVSSEYETLLLPVEAYAGGLQHYIDGVGASDCKRIVTPISGADFAIPIKGDSMEPRFHAGSTLLIRRINERAFIPWGHSMVIDTENGVFVKNLYPGEKNDDGEEYVIAKSLNPDYPPFTIPGSSIRGIYRVLGTVDIFTTL